MDENFEKFFKDPNEEPDIPGTFGTLYLLRRDISSCFSNSILWPGTMCILAGFDLLGKFYAGNDDSKKVGERFKSFLVDVVGCNSDESNILYSLRNSMLHSFGLFDNNRRMILNRDEATFISERDQSYHISVLLLKEKFELGIGNFKRIIRANIVAENNFNSMIGKYGILRIG